MLDTYGRKYFDRYFNNTAKFFLKFNIMPTHITILALILGTFAGIQYYLDNIFFSIILLWVSGYLDAVDGSMARISGNITKTGTLLDIFFDRVVELSFIIFFALKNESSNFALLCLTSAIVLSMSVFLTSGMLVENTGKKSFYYQAGLMERTEGFVMFTVMIIFSSHMKEISFLYAGLILFTVVQRLLESIKILENKR
jgi:CDP-diacylglycerol--glycerol-3-phosphate 3-phosphatidyltransferase